MSLKEQIANDNQNLLFNFDEFAKSANINGVEITVIEDNEQLSKYIKEGLCQGNILLYAKLESFPKTPISGSIILYNNRKYEVDNCIEEDNILTISLKRFKGL